MAILRMIEVSATPVVQATTYASGNALGGICTFSGIGMSDKMQLNKVKIIDKSNNKFAMDLLLFGQSFTPTADKSAINISVADSLNMIGHVNIVAGDWATIGTSLAIATKTFSGGFGIQCNDPLNKIYGQLVARGAQISASTSDLVVLLSLAVMIE